MITGVCAALEPASPGWYFAGVPGVETIVAGVSLQRNGYSGIFFFLLYPRLNFSFCRSVLMSLLTNTVLNTKPSRVAPCSVLPFVLKSPDPDQRTPEASLLR